jgi:hypothetical protein
LHERITHRFPCHPAPCHPDFYPCDPWFCRRPAISVC